jgi:hypothetical protein
MRHSDLPDSEVLSATERINTVDVRVGGRRHDARCHGCR